MAVQVIIPLLIVLNKLHNLGIIHRDVKPENIFFNDQDQLKLGDFGLAIDSTSSRPISRVGTLEYMAPEVCTCGKCNRALSGIICLHSAHNAINDVCIPALKLTVILLVEASWHLPLCLPLGVGATFSC